MIIPLVCKSSLIKKITLIGNNLKIRVNTKYMFRYNQEDNAPFNMVILRSSSWNGSIDLAAFFKSQFYLSQLERLRPIHMNTMEFHSVVAKSIFGAKLSNVNKPISRISDVICLAETYQPSWNLFWYVSRAGTIWCPTNVQNLKGMIMKGWPRRYKYLVILMRTPEHWFQEQDQFGRERSERWSGQYDLLTRPRPTRPGENCAKV